VVSVCDGTPTSVSEALAMLRQALGFLNSTDAASQPAQTQADVLRELERAEARHTAARARFLAAFTAQRGYEADGQGSARAWLKWQTQVTSGRTRRPGDTGDDDEFDDRFLRLITFGGAGHTEGALTPACATALAAVLDALGKKAGPEDTRTAGSAETTRWKKRAAG
jgi:hypothetical protein